MACEYGKTDPCPFRSTFARLLSDTQFHCQPLTRVSIGEQRSLLPPTNLHVSLQQIPGYDEMLDLVGPFINSRHT